MSVLAAFGMRAQNTSLPIDIVIIGASKPGLRSARAFKPSDWNEPSQFIADEWSFIFDDDKRQPVGISSVTMYDDAYPRDSLGETMFPMKRGLYRFGPKHSSDPPDPVDMPIYGPNRKHHTIVVSFTCLCGLPSRGINWPDNFFWVEACYATTGRSVVLEATKVAIKRRFTSPQNQNQFHEFVVELEELNLPQDTQTILKEGYTCYLNTSAS